MTPTSSFVEGLVSVVVPVHNRPDLLREAVRSALDQTYRSVEVVIVDDASDDDTPRAIESLEALGQGRVRRLVHPRRQGPGVARESGRRAARGEFMQYLDSDDLLAPTKLALQVAALRAAPDAVLSYGDVEEVEVATPARTARRRVLPVMERIFPRMLVEHVWHSFVPLYRSISCDPAGSWSGLTQEEDWEYDARIGALGGPICKVDAVVGTMRRHAGHHLSGSLATARSLSQRASARTAILANARSAGVPTGSAEMQHFVRALFLLSRQCGAAGLVEDSRRLFSLAREHSARPEALDFRGYALASCVLGWRTTGVLACALDRLRQ